MLRQKQRPNEIDKTMILLEQQIKKRKRAYGKIQIKISWHSWLKISHDVKK